MPTRAATDVPDPAVLLGDCLDVLGTLEPGSCHLAYLDPPFNTGRTQRSGSTSYDDQWSGPSGYVAFLRPRVEAVCRTLHDQGNLLVHCDWRSAHHVRLMLDDVLGPERFVNHLIWAYGLGGSSPRRFARKHDDILFYARDADYYFDAPMVPATSNRMKGLLKKATDVIDIPTINNMAAERVGYPTQKPLALLELLVSACAPPGGCVLDPFCGSGTTLVAARNLGRGFIGIDASERAVAIARERLTTTSA